MVALSELNRSKVRWYLGYTVQSPSSDWIRLERGMSNILDAFAESRIIEQIDRCETLWLLIESPTEELYEKRVVSGYYQETVDYERMSEHATLTRRFNTECDRLAQSLGARNLRTFIGQTLEPLSTENLPFLPGIQGIQGIQGLQGLKGDKGDRGNVGLPSRDTLIIQRSVTPSNSLLTSFAATKSFILQKAVVNVPCWVRIYDSTNAQVADVSRSSSVDPIAGAGVCAEFTTSVELLTINFSPSAIVSSRTGSVDVPITITNNSNQASVEIEFTYLEIEA